MSDFETARAKMVDTQVRTEGVTDHAVLRAMLDVPRERFLPHRMRSLAYIDDDLRLFEESPDGVERYLVRPAPIARMLQAAEIAPSDFVLAVGCVSGYVAALLARLAGSVVALESNQALADRASAALIELEIDNVAVINGPLEAGLAAEGPYDVIFLTGAVEFVPEALFDQLREGGRLVAVVGYGRAASATVYTRTDDDIGARRVFDVYLPRLPGFRKEASFVF